MRYPRFFATRWHCSENTTPMYVILVADIGDLG